VRLNFNNILAGVAAGFGHESHQSFINRLVSSRVYDVPVMQPVRLKIRQSPG